jgi:uncharacterized repeat protein (TIGR03803 family)
VFKITPAGTLTVLSNLGGDAGSSSYGGLTLGQNGNFYGTTSHGGSGGGGTVFQITANGKMNVLYSFSGCDGCSPSTPPIQGADGNLYGTIPGTNELYGSIYKVSSAGFTTMYQPESYLNC